MFRGWDVRFHRPAAAAIAAACLLAMTPVSEARPLQDKAAGSEAGKKAVAARASRATAVPGTKQGNDGAKPGVPSTVGPPAPPRGRRGAARPAINLKDGAPAPTVVLKPGQAPKAEFDTPVYDFGRVRDGTIVTHDYWFTNTGTGPLELLQVKPSCGCTTSGDYDRIVQPGETGRIPVSINTAKFSGRIEKTVRVHTNAAAPRNMITLHIRGEVWQAITVTPQNAAFSKITEEAEVVRKLVIVNNTDEAMKLTDIASDNKTFRAEAREVEPGKKYELLVTAAPPFATGSLSGNITMNTGMSDPKTLEVFASAYVPPTIDITPRRIAIPFTAAASPRGLKRRIYVRNHDKQHPLKISDVRATNKDIILRTEETVPGSTYQIILEFPQGYEPPPGGDRLTFRTGAASMPVATIPIIMLGRAGRLTNIRNGPAARPAAPRLRPANPPAGKRN